MAIVSFREMVMLKVIVDYMGKAKRPPRINDLITLPRGEQPDLFNAWLRTHEVGAFYATKIVSRKQAQVMIAVLREAELLVSGEGMVPYVPTDAGKAFVAALPPNWKDWYASIPVKNGVVMWHQAKKFEF